MERTATCPACSRSIYPEDAFCSWCGARAGAKPAGRADSPRTMISKAIPTGQRQGCKSCNSPILEGDAFCAVCGARYDVPVESNAIQEMWASILRTLEGSTKGKFEFIRQIGRGGMGTVYLARQMDLDRLVAIKVLSPAWLTNETMVERFRREARTIASIRHPSIVNVHGVGQTADVHYFVMDFIEGVSLSRVLRIHGQLSVPVTRALLYQVGMALSYAHRPSRGVIHRDIKPGNIMLDTEGNAIVTDFGIARASDASSGLTMTGLIMGTPEYMSPEQCRGDDVTPASDQYSLGTVLYGMLAGSPPFSGTDYQVLIKQTTEPVPPLRSVRPDCPPELADAIERMLAKDPADRWPSVAAAVKGGAGKPLTADDPVREEIVRLVATAAPASASAETVMAPKSVAAPAESDTTPTWLRILSLPERLSTGDEIDLRATCVLEDGTEQSNIDIEWESTNPGIARIDPSTGRLVAVGQGAAVITARAQGVTQSVTVNVAAPAVDRLTLDPRHLNLPVGATARLSPTPMDAQGRAVLRDVEWSSSNPAIASVDSDGVVTALKEGLASILAQCGSAGSTTTVSVTEAASLGEMVAPVAGPVVADALEPTTGGRSLFGESHSGSGYDIPATGMPPKDPSGGMALDPPVGMDRDPSGERTADAPFSMASGSSKSADSADGLPWKTWWAAVPVALVAAIMLWVIGSGGNGDADAANASALVALAIPLPDSVEVGDTIPLAATGTMADGTSAAVSADWTSSDPVNVRVSDGVAIAMVAGPATLTAAVDSVRQTARIIVYEPAPSTGPGRLRVGAVVSGIDLDPNGFRVSVDGRNAGSVAAGSELTIRGLEPGVHAVRLTGVASNCRVDGGLERQVTIESGRAAPLEFAVACEARPEPAPTPDPGTLQLRISPYGSVTVAGTAHGDRTRLAVELPAGTHQLSIVREGYQGVSTTLTIRPGATLNLICRLGTQESSCRNP